MKCVAYFFKYLFRFQFFRSKHHAFYKRLFKPLNLFRGVEVQATYDGHFKMRVDIEEWIQQQIFFFGVYDAAGIKFIKQSLQPGDTFLDVGANLGTYSLSASSRLDPDQGGLVHAFEPVSAIRSRLEENLERNGVTHVKVNPTAVFHETTRLEIYLSDRENIGMSSVFHHDAESGKTEEVEAIRLDDYISREKIGKVHLVKIDIEGAELNALKGMKACIERDHPVFLLEISNNVLGEESEKGLETLNFLRDRGYEMYSIQEDGSLRPEKSTENKDISNYVFRCSSQV